MILSLQKRLHDDQFFTMQILKMTSWSVTTMGEISQQKRLINSEYPYVLGPRTT